MSTIKRIGCVFENAEHIALDDRSKFVIISDCHRGDGDGTDNFAKNQNIFAAALQHYYRSGFTYIELGDGDELWAESEFPPIAEAYSGIFRQMVKFHDKNRFYMIYGNHDIIKQNEKWVDENLRFCYDRRLEKRVPLFAGINVHEGLILDHTESGGKILLLHGHQGDFFNDALWPLSRFLVRYLWKPLEAVGVKNPTSASVNYGKKRSVENNLAEWAQKNHGKVMLIAGHTHRGMFPAPGQPAYFNDGCCVNSRYVTAIEIESGLISLAWWDIRVRDDAALYVKRDIIAGPTPIGEYFR